MERRIGGRFTSETFIVTFCAWISLISLETCTVTVCTPSCSSVGIHAKFPAGVIEAPEGAFSPKEYSSASPPPLLAVALNVIKVSSLPDWTGIGSKVRLPSSWSPMSTLSTAQLLPSSNTEPPDAVTLTMYTVWPGSAEVMLSPFVPESISK